jgi:hypothetical protein
VVSAGKSALEAVDTLITTSNGRVRVRPRIGGTLRKKAQSSRIRKQNSVCFTVWQGLWHKR